jgi:hypothetical protein
MGRIANSLESRPFPNHRGSIYSPNGLAPILDKERCNNNLAHSNWVGDNTLGSRQPGALSILGVGIK